MKLLLDVSLQTDGAYALDVARPRPIRDAVQDVKNRLVVVRKRRSAPSNLKRRGGEDNAKQDGPCAHESLLLSA